MTDRVTVSRWGALAAALFLCAVFGVVRSAPAFATVPTGALLNPSPGGPGTTISDADDGTDKLFHLGVRAVATTSGATITLVRFQIKPSGGNSFVTIATGTEVGTTDTWESKWSPTTSGISGGSLRVQVTDSNGEVGYVPNATGQSVVVTGSGNTAEITNPGSGGQLGFSAGHATLSGTASGNTNSIAVFYTKSAATEAQAWVSCGTASPTPSPSGPIQWSATCALQGSDTAGQVQAVAVQPSSVLGGTNSGDAHRLGATFGQQPNTLQFTGPNGAQTVGHCSVFNVKVLDNQGSPIQGARIDVHATGPGNTDVFFASGTGTDPFTSPSTLQSHSSNETAATCDANNLGNGGGATGAPGQTGDEGVHTGTQSTKHIDGSTGANGFTFALVSRTVGNTHLEAWYDVNTNDVNDNSNQACPQSGSGELCAVGTAMWEPATASSVSIDPVQDSTDAGKIHQWTASTLDQHQNPMATNVVSFEVTSGPNSTKDLDNNANTPPGYFGFCVTGGNGKCPKSFTDQAKEAGTDTVTAFLDDNGNLMPDPPAELTATSQQTWTVKTTATSLTIHPNHDKTIQRGQQVTFRGQLISSDRSCVNGSTVILYNGKGVINRFTIQDASIVQRSDGSFGGPYTFTKRPKTTQFYHVEYHGSSACDPSRAPSNGSVQVKVT